MRLTTAVFLAFFLSGCSIFGVFQKANLETEVAEVTGEEGGSFESYEARIDTLVRRAEAIKNNVTNYEDLKELGLNPDSKNVTHYRGSKVLRFLLGTENPQIKLDKPEDLLKFLEEYGHYLVLEYHLHNWKTAADVFYLTHKNVAKSGSDMDFIVILRDGIVLRHYFTGTHRTEKKWVEESASGGVVAAIKEARDFLEIVVFYYLLRDIVNR